MSGTTPGTIRTTALESARLVHTGKVRDVYALGDDLLLVATDRLSAFDVVMAEAIPDKGRVLTELSRFWFGLLADVVPNHLLSTDVDAWPELSPADREVCRGRTMRCRRTAPSSVEWVVRGWLDGGGWREYQASGSISGIALPAGLHRYDPLPEPILTPSTKAAVGDKDEPIDFATAVARVGKDIAEAARDAALELFRRGAEHARSRGFVLADTKFEFGVVDDTLVLIDECLTPDSSRFWHVDDVGPGRTPRSYDKQFVRDWLDASGWDHTPPPPALPADVVARTAATYREICARLTAPSAEASS